MNRRLMIVLVAAVLMFSAGDAAAQRRSGTPARAERPAHEEKIDITAMYGHMWGGNISSYVGTFRLGTAPSMFFALDYPVAPANWVELSYGHQDGKLLITRLRLSVLPIVDGLSGDPDEHAVVGRG